ncbi:glycosyltransferase family 2 protein [Bariatricus sp. HCP28S3_A7]|uniref:glycosyltransferase family 2 protein n=1 Tax=Bariatricus sp. HCP28S3_A7 TaxID=3438894 RepID=UPI003F8CCF90
MNENQPLVSIIMPVYNCERFLSESIESVISQSYKNWELLIVDDGSKDKSVSIIESYVAKDSRIRFYKNESGEHGPGSARNYGMEQIQGKYTYFIDSDDWIEKDLLQDTVTLAEQKGADIVPFGYIIEDNGKKIKKPLKPCGNFEYQDFKNIANEIVRGTWASCKELIRTELLLNVRQNKYKTGEDICFQMDLLCNVRKVCGIDKEYYHYRIVKDSITHSDKWDDMFMESYIAIWDKERKFLEYCGLDDSSQIVKNTAIERYTWCLYCLCEKRCPLSLTKKYRQIKYIANMMDINNFKNKFKCTSYSGIRKIVKLLVKYNLEMMLILVGTLYFKICGMIYTN